jgi:glycosyltransferase involved in cell wall biosynthesis
MKIKYIANFNDGTGWAKAATYKALALDHAGYDVYCEELKYNNVSIVLEDRISQLLDKKSDQFDIIMQHVLPSEYKYYPNAKNIGVFEIDTLNLSNTFWIKKLSMMDQIFVPNKASKQSLINSGIKVPIDIFPHLFNYDKIVNLNKAAEIMELNNTFNFMFVGEFAKQKNLEGLLRAFHAEFEYIEPVSLYIKVEKDLKVVEEFCEAIKQRLRKNGKYKKEVIVNSYMPDQILWSTMIQCHCFVNPSYGDAWCYPAMEASAMGMPVIYTAGTGVEEYSEESNAIPSMHEGCYGVLDTIEGLYTCEDFWLEPSVLHLQKKMRGIYDSFINNREYYLANKKAKVEEMKYYDYRNSDILKGLI